MNSNFLNVLGNNPCSYTPIWLMRQAGRYLPEYRKTREKAGSFLGLCKNPDYATEVTLQPIRRFALDASIMFSDILVVPEAMGMDLYFTDGEGPKFGNPLQNNQDINNLKPVNPERDLGFVLQTIKNLKNELPATIPLIGFSGSPWTLACYMIEGGSSKNYEKIKTWVYQYPQQLHLLLDKITLEVSNYLIAQINAGVDSIMLFDSWGGVLSQTAFCEFSLNYLQKIFLNLKLAGYEKIPSISFTKGSSSWISQLTQLDCSVLGIDWTVNIGQVRKQTNKIIQGNLDPVILSVTDGKTVANEAKKILDGYREQNNGSFDKFVFNLGHGILPTANPDNVAILVDTVHEYTQR